MRYEDIIAGKHNIPCSVAVDPTTPFKNLPTDPIDRFVKMGKEALIDAIQKGVADMYADGRITFNRDFYPYWGDPMASVQNYMSGPRVLLGETDGTSKLIPYNHPLDATMQKTAIDSSATGAWNPIYGAIATIQVAQQQNLFASLPKRPYNRYGIRIVSAAAMSSSAGIAEGAGPGTPLVPTYLEVNVGQKEVAIATDMSNRMELFSTRDDTITFGGNAQVVFSNFMNSIDADLNGDCDTVAGYNVESIDRLTANYALYGTYAKVGTATDINLYNTVRSVAAAANYWDSNCYAASSDRALTLPLIDNMYAACYPYWGNDIGNKIWVTTPTTQVYWSFAEGAKQCFGQETVAHTYTQGVQPVLGQAGGYKTATYSNLPLILDANVQADTIGQIYLLDLNHTGMLTGRPIEAIQGNNPVYLNYFLNRLVFYGIMELYGDLPKSCAQLRNLA